MSAVFILLAVYQLKTILCNLAFPTGACFSRLGKPVLVMLATFGARGLVHGVATFLIVKFLWSTTFLFGLKLAGIDCGIRFAVNLLSDVPSLLSHYSPLFTRIAMRFSKFDLTKIETGAVSWYQEQLDEVTHHAVHYFIIWSLVH